MIYPYHGIQFSIKVQPTVDTCSCMNESPHDYDNYEGKKASPPPKIILSFHVHSLIGYKNKSNDKKQITGCLDGGSGGSAERCGRKG